MKRLIMTIAMLALCGCSTATKKPANARTHGSPLINPYAVSLRIEKCHISRIEAHSGYYSVVAYSPALGDEICILDDMPASALNEYPINSTVYRLYDSPERTFDIRK